MRIDSLESQGTVRTDLVVHTVLLSTKISVITVQHFLVFVEVHADVERGCEVQTVQTPPACTCQPGTVLEYMWIVHNGHVTSRLYTGPLSSVVKRYSCRVQLFGYLETEGTENESTSSLTW